MLFEANWWPEVSNETAQFGDASRARPTLQARYQASHELQDERGIDGVDPPAAVHVRALLTI